jgi:hypothetical protein
MSLHDNHKPQPLLYQSPKGQPCPVCGQRSYSLTGIHPQCAVQQADMPRQRRLAAAKRRERERAEQQKADTAPVAKKVLAVKIATR